MYLAKLTHATCLILTALVVGAGVWPRSKSGAVAAAALVAATPWSVLLGSVAYNEGGLMLFTAVALLWALRAGESGTLADWAVCGLAVGFACGCKYTAVPLLLVGIPLAGVLAGVLTGGRGQIIPSLRGATVVLGVGLLSFSPWLVRNAIWVGNPVFPQLTGVFLVEGWGEVLQDRWRIAHSPNPADGTRGARFLGQIVLDWRYAYLLLPLGLLGGGLASVRRGTRPAGIMMLLLIVGFTLFWLLATHLQSRFFVLAVPVLAVAAVWAGRRELAALAGVAAAVSLVVTVLYVPAKLAPFRAAIGLPTVEPIFEALHPPEVRRAAAYAAQTGTPVTLVGDAQAWFWPMPVRSTTVFSADGATPLEAYDARPGDLIVVSTPDLERLARTYHKLPPPEPDWQGEFVIRP